MILRSALELYWFCFRCTTIHEAALQGASSKSELLVHESGDLGSARAGNRFSCACLSLGPLPGFGARPLGLLRYADDDGEVVLHQVAHLDLLTCS